MRTRPAESRLQISAADGGGIQTADAVQSDSGAPEASIARLGRDLAKLAETMREPYQEDREHRVQLLGDFAQDMLAGRMPKDEARLFVAGALWTWLERGGRLERDYLRVTKRASRRTPSVMWRALQSAHRDEDKQRGRPAE